MIRKSVAAVMCSASLCVFAVARDERALTPEADEAAQKLRDAVDAEAKDPAAPDWAGWYYSGDGLGFNHTVHVAPKAGYLFQWTGCLGVYDRSWGTASLKDNTLSLVSMMKGADGQFHRSQSDYSLVRWGRRLYLIPPDAMVSFCNNVNNGSEPRTSMRGEFLLRAGDENKPAGNQPPAIPDAYREYLLASPVGAKVMAVGTPSTRPARSYFNNALVTITLDAGTAEGLRTGMVLHQIKPRNYERVVIRKVEEHRCEAVASLDEKDPVPQVGWSYCTSPSGPQPRKADDNK